MSDWGILIETSTHTQHIGNVNMGWENFDFSKTEPINQSSQTPNCRLNHSSHMWAAYDIEISREQSGKTAF